MDCNSGGGSVAAKISRSRACSVGYRRKRYRSWSESSRTLNGFLGSRAAAAALLGAGGSTAAEAGFGAGSGSGGWFSRCVLLHGTEQLEGKESQQVSKDNVYNEKQNTYNEA